MCVCVLVCLPKQEKDESMSVCKMWWLLACPRVRIMAHNVQACARVARLSVSLSSSVCFFGGTTTQRRAKVSRRASARVRVPLFETCKHKKQAKRVEYPLRCGVVVELHAFDQHNVGSAAVERESDSAWHPQQPQ